MENGYGGPVWHASVAEQGPFGPVRLWMANERAMWELAHEALTGVGDPGLGEWRERLGKSIHLKRRLTAEEWGGKPWGMDLRASREGHERLAPIAAWFPPVLDELTVRHVGDRP